MAKLFANSGDPDQTPHSAASDLGLHCLPVTLLGASRLPWVNLQFSRTPPLSNVFEESSDGSSETAGGPASSPYHYSASFTRHRKLFGKEPSMVCTIFTQNIGTLTFCHTVLKFGLVPLYSLLMCLKIKTLG